MMNEQHVDILELLVRCCEGAATEDEIIKLEKLLEDNQEILEYVIELLTTLSCLRSCGRASSGLAYAGNAG